MSDQPVAARPVPEMAVPYAEPRAREEYTSGVESRRALWLLGSMTVIVSVPAGWLKAAVWLELSSGWVAPPATPSQIEGVAFDAPALVMTLSMAALALWVIVRVTQRQWKASWLLILPLVAFAWIIGLVGLWSLGARYFD